MSPSTGRPAEPDSQGSHDEQPPSYMADFVVGRRPQGEEDARYTAEYMAHRPDIFSQEGIDRARRLVGDPDDRQIQQALDESLDVPWRQSPQTGSTTRESGHQAWPMNQANVTWQQGTGEVLPSYQEAAPGSEMQREMLYAQYVAEYENPSWAPPASLPAARSPLDGTPHNPFAAATRQYRPSGLQRSNAIRRFNQSGRREGRAAGPDSGLQDTSRNPYAAASTQHQPSLPQARRVGPSRDSAPQQPNQSRPQARRMGPS